MSHFFRILRFAAPYRLYAALNVLFNILSTVFHLASLLVFIPFLSLLFNQVEPVLDKPVWSWSRESAQNTFNWYMSGYIQENGAIGGLIFICGVVAVLFLVKNITRYLAMYFIGVLRNRTVQDIRTKIYDKILELPLQFFSEERKGDIIARVTSDVQDVEFSIFQYIAMLFREPITIALSLTLMIMISPQLTLISLILLPISGLIIGRVGKSLKRKSVKGQQKNADLLSLVEETLGGLRVVKAFNGEHEMRERFKRENDELSDLSISILRKRDMASPLSEFLGALVMVALVYLGGSLVLGESSELNGEQFIGYIILFSQILTPAKSFSTGYFWIQKGSASAERILDLLAKENPIVEKPNAESIATLNDCIAFNKVEFGYGDELVLHGIDLNIKKGQSLALVGTSGGGKTTIAGLLPRFMDVTGGSITIDGKDIRDLRIKDLRSLMGIVTQDSILFNGTVKDNITFGTEHASDEDVRNAARVANALEFIEELPNGFETNIGDGGNRLSGGQKQRVSIARAVLNNPPVLIMDEATSALDTESEKLVQDALIKLMKERTSLVIAHRLSTIQHCDGIVVLQAGRVVEQGTHKELYDKGGQYRKLCDMQAFES
jgi:subfamily B ATP-binding cassette protein MsbA